MFSSPVDRINIPFRIESSYPFIPRRRRITSFIPSIVTRSPARLGNVLGRGRSRPFDSSTGEG